MNEPEIRRRIEDYKSQKERHERQADLYAGAQQALEALLMDDNASANNRAPGLLDLDREGNENG